MAKKKFYAVQNGRVPGVYLTWEECKRQVDGFSGASFKSFPTMEEAERFAKGRAMAGDMQEGQKALTPAREKQKSQAAAREEQKTPTPVQALQKDALFVEAAAQNDAANAVLARNSAEAVAYVDGSYYHPSRRFSCGVVLFWKGQELHFHESYSDAELAAMRNVAGEIKGAQTAMQFCLDHGISSLCVYHDYEGIAKWCEGQWEAKKEGTKAYREFYRKASENVKITFCKVKGHSGDVWNDLADQLAKEALERV